MKRVALAQRAECSHGPPNNSIMTTTLPLLSLLQKNNSFGININKRAPKLAVRVVRRDDGKGTATTNTAALGIRRHSSSRIVSVSAGALGGLLGGIFGTGGTDLGESTRQTYANMVALINQMEPEISLLSVSQLRERTSALQQRARSGAHSLDSLLPEAFSIVREASKRVLGLRPFDVQLIGGMVLHKGEIAEMKTGEGKTLVAILPAFLNALAGKGVHVVTVNEYLARRVLKFPVSLD